jgi:hypothetical protein
MNEVTFFLFLRSFYLQACSHGTPFSPFQSLPPYAYHVRFSSKTREPSEKTGIPPIYLCPSTQSRGFEMYQSFSGPFHLKRSTLTLLFRSLMVSLS